jgi:hypothetical protein
VKTLRRWTYQLVQLAVPRGPSSIQNLFPVIGVKHFLETDDVKAAKLIADSPCPIFWIGPFVLPTHGIR